MKKLLSLVLALALYLGLCAVPAYGAEGDFVVPMEEDWSGTILLDDILIEAPDSWGDSPVEGQLFYQESTIALIPNPSFTAGLVTAVGIEALNSGEKMYFYQRLAGDTSPTPRVEISFQQATTVDGKAVSLTDPTERYALFYTWVENDGIERTSSSLFRIGTEAEHKFVIDNSGVLTRYNGQDAHVVIPEGITAIGREAFAGRTELTTVVIPNSVTYIADRAFAGCSKLTEITIPSETVIYDTDSVFQGCNLLDISSRYHWGDSVANGTIVGYSTYMADTKYGFVFCFLHEDGTLVSIADIVDPSEWEARKRRTPQDFYGGNLGKYGEKSYAWLWENVSNELNLPEGIKTIIDFPNCPGLERVIFPAPANTTSALKYQDIALRFSNCLSLKQIVNCPDQTLYERLAANQKIEAAYQGATPQSYLAPQSKRIITLSNQICAGCTTEYEKAKAIFDWVTANIGYDNAYYYGSKNTVAIEPEEVLNSKLTICSGYTNLTQALLLAQNIPAVGISGLANNGSDWENGSPWISHAWNAAYVDGRWIYIDTTWGDSNPNWFDPTLFGLSISHTANMIYDTFSATPNRSTVLVNGQSVAFDAYTINQNNYFKLRDLAKVLSGTGKQFEVTWDGNANAINMLSGKPYTAVGGELAQGDGTDKTAAVNTATVYLDGQPVSLLAYTINQNNYFKLRDVGQAFDFDVTWDGARNTIVIDTTQSYTPD